MHCYVLVFCKVLCPNLRFLPMFSTWRLRLKRVSWYYQLHTSYIGELSPETRHILMAWHVPRSLHINHHMLIFSNLQGIDVVCEILKCQCLCWRNFELRQERVCDIGSTGDVRNRVGEGLHGVRLQRIVVSKPPQSLSICRFILWFLTHLAWVCHLVWHAPTWCWQGLS